MGYQSVDGTATAGLDYQAVSGRLTFAAGGATRTQTISVPINDDELDESDEETFTLTLSDAVHALLAGGQRLTAVGTIVDDDASTFSIAGASAREDAGSIEFVATLSSPQADERSVSWATADGTAVDGDDYSAASGTLTFEPGDLRRTVVVELVDDVAQEPTETFIVTLSQATDPTVIGTASAVGTILPDDDFEPAIGLRIDESSEDVTEGEPITFTLERTRCAGCPLSGLLALAHPVTITVTGGFVDSALPTEVTFEAGAELAEVVLPTVDDAIDADDGSATLSIPFSATIGLRVLDSGASHTVRIVDDDTRGVTIEPASPTVIEGGNGSYTVVLDTEPTANVTVTISYPEGAPFTVAPSTMTFTNQTWETTQSVTIDTAQDDDAEDELASVTHAFVGGDYDAMSVVAEVRVEDRETASDQVTLSVSPQRVAEAGGAQEVVIAARLNAAPRKAATTVRVESAAGTATEADFAVAGVPVEVVIAAGSLQGAGTVTVTPVADEIAEQEEAFTITGEVVDYGTEGASGSLAVVATELKISDDDERGVTIEPEQLAVEEGASAAYTVVLDSQPQGTVGIDVVVPEAVDVLANPERLSFTADDWQIAQTVSVDAVADPDADADPAVVITHVVSGADYVEETAAGVTVTITETTEPTFTADPARADEDEGAVQFDVVLNVESDDSLVTVDYETSDGSAVAGADYTAASGTLTFADVSDEPYPQTRSVRIAVMDDVLDENEETLTLTLSKPLGAVFSGAQELMVTGTIVDDDRQPLISGIGSSSPGTSNTSESSERIAFRVELSEPSGLQVSVQYRTTVPTVQPRSEFRTYATATEDYTAVSGALTFAASETVHTIEVPLLDDRIEEGSEFFFLELFEPRHAMLRRQRVLAEITDDDIRMVTVSPNSLQVDEGMNEAFTVGLGTMPTGNVTVEMGVDGSTDVTASPDSLTFTPATWSTSQSVLVTAKSDEDAVNDVAYVRFTVMGGDYEGENVSRLPVTVVDDDEASSAVVLTMMPTSVRESVGSAGQEVAVTGALNHAVRVAETVVTVWLEDAGAESPADYEAVSPFTLTIPAGVQRGTARSRSSRWTTRLTSTKRP